MHLIIILAASVRVFVNASPLPNPEPQTGSSINSLISGALNNANSAANTALENANNNVASALNNAGANVAAAQNNAYVAITNSPLGALSTDIAGAKAAISADSTLQLFCHDLDNTAVGPSKTEKRADVVEEAPGASTSVSYSYSSNNGDTSTTTTTTTSSNGPAVRPRALGNHISHMERIDDDDPNDPNDHAGHDHDKDDDDKDDDPDGTIRRQASSSSYSNSYTSTIGPNQVQYSDSNGAVDYKIDGVDVPAALQGYQPAVVMEACGRTVYYS